MALICGLGPLQHLRCVPIANGIVAFPQERNIFLCAILEHFLAKRGGVKRVCAVFQILLFACLKICHQLIKICRAVFRLHVQHLFTVCIRFVPITIGKEHFSALQQRSDRWIYRGSRSCRCVRSRRSAHAFPHDLIHTPQKILHRAHLAHVLRLELGELLGHIVGVDALVAGDQVLALVFGHQLQIAAPLVFHPHGVVILIVRAEGQHDFGGVQRGKDIRFVLCAKLVLQ